MNAKAPRFFNDVYRDLRDRHLLLPAVALIAALIAVPVFLAKPAEPAPPPPPAAPTADTTAVTSAVLVGDSTPVRKYQERLAKLKSKNPFDINIKIDKPSDGGSTDGTSTDTATGDVATGASSPTDTTVSSPTTGSGASSDVSSGTPTDTSGSDTTNTPAEPEIHFFAGRVDVTMGPIGKGRDYDNVKYLTFLPDDANPVATFVGLTGSGRSEQAVFAISGQAAVQDGDGTCAPHKPDACEFLTLKPGDSQYIRFADKTYRLKVRDTRIVEIKDPRDQSADGDDAATDGTNDGGKSSPAVIHP